MYKPCTGNETSKIRNRIVTYLNGRGLDIGAGGDPIYPKEAERKIGGTTCLSLDFNYPTDAQVDARKVLEIFAPESFDWVYSSHALEDNHYWEAVLRDWYRLVSVGGRIILYLPLTRRVARDMGLENWADFYPNIGDADPDINTDHRTDFVPAEVVDYLTSLCPGEIEVNEIRNTKDDDEYSFLIVIKKLGSIGLPGQRIVKTNGHDRKRALVIRYGAFGDMVMSTPAIRLLAEQGYAVDVNCSAYGKDVIANNPYVNNVLIQERNAIPSDSLKDYWKELALRYDRIANLTQSVEDNLLVADYNAFRHMAEVRAKCSEKITDRQIFLETIKVYRKQFGDKNYYDAHLEKAGLDERGLNGELYFTDIEHRMAHDFLGQHRGQFLVLWSLSGSAYHKIYPYFYHAVQGMLNSIKDVLVVSVGDMQCRMMEAPPSGRYLPRSGDWSVRMSMLMTMYADLVIGPETGILNAAGCFDTPKITLRSHSSHDNLCKYWKNDFCMEPDPEKVPCYPCHMLHFTDGSCLTAPIINTKISGMVHPLIKSVMPENNETSFEHPLCVSYGVRPEQIVAKVKEIRERFPLKNPRTTFTDKAETPFVPSFA